MKTNIFNCKIVFFQKSIKYRNEFGELIYKQMNIITYIKKYSKEKKVKNRFNKWLGIRLNKIIDNILQIIGAGVIAYLINKIF